MVLDGAAGRDVEERPGDDEGDEGHHLEVGGEGAELLVHRPVPVGGGLT